MCPNGRLGLKRAQHLIEREAFRRIMAGQIPEMLDEFARELAVWLAETHPTAAGIPLTTVERQLEDLWHRRHEMIRGGGS